MRGLRTWLTIIGICLALCCRLASAEAPPEADRKFQEGMGLLKAKKPAEALKAFQESREIQKSPNTLLRIAECYKVMGKIGTAYKRYQQAAHEAQDEYLATRKWIYKVTQQLATREAEKLDRRVPRLTLVLPEGMPEDTVVAIDGELVPRSSLPAPQDLDPGDRQVTVTGSRLRPLTVTQPLRNGEMKRLELAPEPLPTATVALVLYSKPLGLEVRLDGKLLSPDRVERRHYVDVGPHEVAARAPGYSSFRWKQTLADGEYAKVRVALKEKGGTPRGAFATMTVAALAGLGVGTGFLVKAYLAQRDEELLDALLRSPDARDQIRADRTAGAVGMAAGGACAVAAVVLGFTTQWRNEAPRRTMSLMSVPAPGGGSLVLGGGF